MPDSPNDLVPRVAVLEQIAKDTREALARIERRFDATDARIDKLGAELRGEIAGVRAELRAETAKLGTELRGEIAGVRAEVNGVRAEINGARAEINGVRTEVASVRSIQWTTFLWLLALLLGTFGSLLGVMAKGFRWL